MRKREPTFRFIQSCQSCYVSEGRTRAAPQRNPIQRLSLIIHSPRQKKQVMGSVVRDVNR